MEWKKDGFEITDNPQRINLEVVNGLLSESYWAKYRPPELMEQAIPSSLCFSLFSGDRQIGFARAVTDRATFAWICDVIIHADFRGKGLGIWLMDCVTEHKDIAKTQQLLKTRDADQLYARYGFQRDSCMQRSAGYGRRTDER